MIGRETFPNAEEFHKFFGAEQGRVSCELDYGEFSSKGTMQALSATHDPWKDWFVARLRGEDPEWAKPDRGELKILDLFSGCGGLSMGVREAAVAAGYRPRFLGAFDLDPVALEVYQRNLRAENVFREDVSDLHEIPQYWSPGGPELNEWTTPPEARGKLRDLSDGVDLLIGGPPCQGHSNLNNHTRRADRRNLLYLTMPTVAEALGVKCVIVENVPEVLNDSHRVVEIARALFRESGFHVPEKDLIIDASDHGVAQRRRRHFLVASKIGVPPLEEIVGKWRESRLSAFDALSDLEDAADPMQPFDAPSVLSKENQGRVAWLHKMGKVNLPNNLRPDCHKGGHTYPSVYGRLKSDEPSLTVTTGFLSPGRGRYTHYSQPRSLTPHEGARLQGFPDSFEFLDKLGAPLKRASYSKLIGDAVPPPLGFVPALAALLTL